MRMWEVWSEGYSCSGNQAKACFHGLYEGEAFIDAIKACMEFDRPENKKHYNFKGWPSFWGCRFYDNEADARRDFG